MRHSISLSIVLSLMLSTTSFRSALGRTASTMDPVIEWFEPSGEGVLKTIGRWLSHDKDHSARRWSHPAFRIRLGRRISIKFPKR